MRLVAYTADPWESALPVLRYRAPAQVLGISVMQGNQGPQVDPSKVAEADLVIIQRDFSRFVESCQQVLLEARRLGKPVIYELDDLLFALPDGHVSKVDLIKILHPMLWTLLAADLVTVSSRVLQETLQPLNPKIRLLGNYLPDDLWPLQAVEANPGETVRVGYMGGQTHLADLESIQPALEAILERYPDTLSLHFWGVRPPDSLLQHRNVRWEPLDLLDYAEFAGFFRQQRCDIFLAPLVDTPFNRAKSGIKFLEYSSLGAPGVYSRLAPYLDFVREGENGLLAETTEDWVRAIAYLVEHPAARQALGSAAQETARRKGLLSRHASEWQVAFDQAAWNSESQHAEEPEGDFQKLEAGIRLVSDVARQALERHLYLEGEQARLGIALQENQVRVEALASELESAQAHNQLLQTQLTGIYASRSWKLIARAQQLRLQLIPQESRRENFLRKLGLLGEGHSQGPNSGPSRITPVEREQR